MPLDISLAVKVSSGLHLTFITSTLRSGESPTLLPEMCIIMPNHLHMIFILNEETGGASPSPTIPTIVCAFKSLCVKELKKCGFRKKLFQRSYYDHVIRGREDYEEISKYIYENPINWETDELYNEV